MATLHIPPQLTERLQTIARRENRPVEAVLESMLDQYAPQPELPPLQETDLLAAGGSEVLARYMQSEEYQAALAQIRPRLYARARAYWQETGDADRLALTDEELDEQFWLFDHDGIPRLKSDLGEFELPPDPLIMMAAAAHERGYGSGETDISERSREILRTEYTDHLLRRVQEQDDAL